MSEGDNPPIGILLCTQRDHTLVEYALVGIDNSLIVSKYQLELPKKEEMQRFIEEQVRETGYETVNGSQMAIIHLRVTKSATGLET